MLTKRIIPCLDVRDGRVVKGVKFENLVDVGDPAELAQRYEAEGADEIVFLDVTATIEGRRAILDVISRTAERLFIPLTVGGGVKTYDDVKTLLRSGADKVSMNTAALEHPDLITRCAADFGSQCVVVAIDSRRRDGHRVHVRSGTVDTGRSTIEWAAEAVRRGAGELLVTSMDRDGTRDGYDLELTRAVADAAAVPVIASGGCGTVTHLHEALTRGGADAALAASIFHVDRIPVSSAKDELRRQGLLMR